MINNEPLIKIGIIQNATQVSGKLNGKFRLNDVVISDVFRAEAKDGLIIFYDCHGEVLARNDELLIENMGDGNFTINDVIIGIDFHWQRSEPQTFAGSLSLLADGDSFVGVNKITLDSYIRVVISSEMNERAPLEFLKAQAIVARSWAMAALQIEEMDEYSMRTQNNEVIRWYCRGKHHLFDFCADDHCQRYHGILKTVSPQAFSATKETRGVFLVSNGEICDARYHKSCGGISDDFHIAWEYKEVPYLSAISDALFPYAFISDEEQATEWITKTPAAYCNVTDKKILAAILPSFDQETTDFFRWKIVYQREELEELIKGKSEIEIGKLVDIVPLARGCSGRIFRLKIIGTTGEVVIGKELEIRRWLSKSHLYSSAFVIKKIGTDRDGFPIEFILNGAGWGHGIGLCQIGAANMAWQGFSAEEILRHYFNHTQLMKLY